MAAPHATCDIDDWDRLDTFSRAHSACNFLTQQGFCIIQSSLNERVKLSAQREANNFRRERALKRVPREALPSLFGETASCWTKELSSPEGEVPPGEESLRKVDSLLQDVGNCISGLSHLCCQLELQGRTAGVLHHSKMPEDRPPPALRDLDEAEAYMALSQARKVTLLYYLGPSQATLTITPRHDPGAAFEVTLKSDVIIAYRNDECLVSYATRGWAVSVQVDYVARMKAGHIEGARDVLPAPTELEEWYRRRMELAAEQDGGPSDSLPRDFLREAKLHFFKREPVLVRQVWFDLPALPVPEDVGLSQLQAVILAGQDVVTEISSPDPLSKEILYPRGMPVLSGAKWEMSEYYDEDPQNATDFKMYTKHMSVVRHEGLSDFVQMREFGITAMEDATLDHRARMLYEAHWSVVDKACPDRTEVKGKELAFYCGMSGQSMLMFMGRKAKINKHSLMGMSHAAIVSRLPYAFHSRGPALAVDTEDSSGSAALNNAVQWLLQEQHGPAAFASGASYVDGPMETIMQCAAGILSYSGRSRVFDETSDGFVKGEGVVCAMLVPFRDADGKTVGDKNRVMPALVGSALNSKGQSSTLTAPNGPALIDVVHQAAEKAHVPFNFVDAVEANANGTILADLIELGATRQAVRTGERDDRKHQSVPLRAAKSTYGSLAAPSGLVSVVRTCALLRHGLHGPSLHLRQLVDTAALGSEEEGEFFARLHFLTEAIEARGPHQFVGISSFGTTGTNVHQILWGTVHTDHYQQKSAVPIKWWPGGDMSAGKQPTLGYYIVGTMTAWETPLPMEDEGEGVFGYTFTMGENNWECFQIWVDRDEDKVLHPTKARAWKESTVEGPERGVGRELCWCITGMMETVRLINEEQARELQAADEQAATQGLEPPSREQRFAAIYLGNHIPEGHTCLEDMPTTRLNSDGAGKPGDKYRIRLHVRGKYKRLEWTKATGLDAICLPEAEPFVHEYFLIGDHSYWQFQPMRLDTAQPGVYAAEVLLLRERSTFQIFRDRDWEQGFYPASASAAADARIMGPDERGAGLKWQIRGKVGDVCRVEFRRLVRPDGEARSIRWEYLRSEAVDFEKLAESHEYFVVGTWSDFRNVEAMDYDEDTERYTFQVRMGTSGQESFQILQNENWLASVHPSFNDATVFGEDGHTTEGPDDEGAGKYWTIGLDPGENVSAGDAVTVILEMKGGLPARVRWEASEDEMSHQLKLAMGCRRVFERHCRLLGISQATEPHPQAAPEGSGA